MLKILSYHCRRYLKYGTATAPAPVTTRNTATPQPDNLKENVTTMKTAEWKLVCKMRQGKL